MRWRIAVSAAIGFASGAFCWFLMKHLHQDAADFRWALHLAHRLLARQNPYDTPLEQYPLTAALFALPFVPLQPELAAGLFWGISSSALAFGLTRHGYTRLLIFLAYPYWAGLITAQCFPSSLPVDSFRCCCRQPWPNLKSDCRFFSSVSAGADYWRASSWASQASP